LDIILKMALIWLASSFFIGIVVGKMMRGSAALLNAPNIAATVQGAVQGSSTAKAS